MSKSSQSQCVLNGEPHVSFSSHALSSQVHILLPPLLKLRTIVEWLQPMSDILVVRANNNKCLQLLIHTEGVKVEMEWKDCMNPKSSFLWVAF